jgi:CRP-like cAMP-binding protein/predicted MFS family arabinose efflux permease
MTALAEATTRPRSLRARLRSQFAEPIEAFGSIWNNLALRRLEYAWAASVVGAWAFGTALGVYAFNQGGATAVGVAGLLRTLPTVLFAPLISTLGDRYARVRVMIGSDMVRGALFTACAVAIVAGGPAILVYLLAGAVMLAASVFRPAQAALLPSITETPQQLTAMNVVSSTVESVGFFAGPALGGILLALTNPETVFAASAVTCLWSAVLLVGIPEHREGAEPEPEAAAHAESPEGGLLRESIEGFRTIASDRGLLTMVSLFTAQTIVAGALNVFVVVLALDLYDSGPVGVGVLSAVLGVGGVLGAAAAAGLVGGQRLVKGFIFGLVFWGAPLIAIGALPWQFVGLIGVAVIGIANTVIDVSGFTLLQRAVPDAVLARVFGVLETVLIGGIGLGSLITPPIIDALGLRWALVAVGAFLPLLAALTWRRLRALDPGPTASPENIDLLRSYSLFEPFQPQVIETLASRLEVRAAAPGEAVIREGDAGDRFYVIRDGQFAVEVGGEEKAQLGPGDCFGEVALLRDVPRTATVTAQGSGGELLALRREDFVPAVRLELLKSLALFRLLPAPTLEFLASRLNYHEVMPGEVIVREGDDGDRFYIVAEGKFDVTAGGELRTELGRGDFFGEIALLKNVKRTATVTARSPGVLFSLARDHFVPAVTGCAPSSRAAEDVVGARLGSLSQRPVLPN